MHYKVTLQINLEGIDDIAVVRRTIEDRLNSGEFFEICSVYSVDPIQDRDAGCDPGGACATHGRCWTHSEWTDKGLAKCAVRGCEAAAYWFGPQGMSLCLNHYDKLRNPRSSVSMGAEVKTSEDTKQQADKTNANFVQVALRPVPANGPPFFCTHHGSVSSYVDSNRTMHCHQCYNDALIKIEDKTFMEHMDKVIRRNDGDT